MHMVYRWHFVGVYCLLGLVLLGSAFYFGRGIGYLRVKQVGAYCKGLNGFNACMVEVVASEGGEGSSVSCQLTKHGIYLCDVRNVAGCFDVTAWRARQGYPVTGTVAQRANC